MTSPVPASLGLSPAEVAAVLEAAATAPSVHNSQPWQFRVLPDRIELHADLTRRLLATDPDDKELRLACGAALANLRIALEALGVRPLLTLLPRGTRALAVVRRGGHVTPADGVLDLRRAIPARHTNRKPFLNDRVTPVELSELVHAAQSERSWLHPVTDPVQRNRLHALVVRAHQVQLANVEFRAELERWTGHGGERRDGVPARAAGPAHEPQDQWVLRDFSGGRARERLPGKDFEPEPLIAVVCSYYEGRLAELHAGQAMQRVLLTATTLGLSASFIAQPIEVPSCREELRRLLGAGVNAQTILRVGHGSPVASTPRRPVAELLIDAEPVLPGGTP
ncbi:Acg family FMN-binding oxidoreductase [Kutzneria sp. CA-103260]|uniref:Acg family FMN-binding oxidoreductase n=1 Tax=Kutzneria sp. CA-103260 TaxID=2802641 RepID=UPI001BA463D7|nr:nitroreductase family protein [Kutzneria sp. CA-103260]QUQ64041.1 nitroreductase [Kutzneria sp. CA-103260]